MEPRGFPKTKGGRDKTRWRCVGRLKLGKWEGKGAEAPRTQWTCSSKPIHLNSRNSHTTQPCPSCEGRWRKSRGGTRLLSRFFSFVYTLRMRDLRERRFGLPCRWLVAVFCPLLPLMSEEADVCERQTWQRQIDLLSRSQSHHRRHRLS